jgi:hypothetical protein
METQTHMFYGDYDIVRRDIKLSHTKIEKHHHHLVMHKTPMMAQRERAMFYPNYFYFAVPSGLVDLAVVLVQGLPYGVFNLDMMRVGVPLISVMSSLNTSIWPSFLPFFGIRLLTTSMVFNARVVVVISASFADIAEQSK